MDDLINPAMQILGYTLFTLLMALVAIAFFKTVDQSIATFREWCGSRVTPVEQAPLAKPPVYSLIFNTNRMDAIYVIPSGDGIDEGLEWSLDVKSVDIIRSLFDQWAMRKSMEKHDAKLITEHPQTDALGILDGQS
jgi:hypothetical protein